MLSSAPVHGRGVHQALLDDGLQAREQMLHDCAALGGVERRPDFAQTALLRILVAAAQQRVLLGVELRDHGVALLGRKCVVEVRHHRGAARVAEQQRNAALERAQDA